MFAGTAALVSLAILLGGGTRQGLWSDGIVQVAGLVLLGLLVWRAKPAIPRPIAAFLVALFLLPLIQLVPLPVAVWTALPGREAIAATYRDAGLPLPALPISLDPAATWRALFGLIPPAAVFIATIGLGYRARRSLSVIFIGLGIVSVLLGLAQLMQGPASSLRFFPITNVNESVGFFANRNHYAALLYGLIPLTAAWTVGFVFDRRPERFLGLLVCVLAYAAFMIGLGMARSRAGILLAVLAVIGSLLLAARNGRKAGRRSTVFVVLASLLGVFLVVRFALVDLVSRFDSALLSDGRLDMARTTILAAPPFQPIGSGFGTFEAVYRMFEVPDRLRWAYANHAHNDWLELWLEGGWLALALAAAFLVWFVAAAVRGWRAAGPGDRVLDRALAQAGTITVALLLLHSGLDYPLRTTTLLVLLGFCAALLVEPPPVPEKPEPVAVRRQPDERRSPSAQSWSDRPRR